MQAAKTRILVKPLCGTERGNWLNPTLITSLIAMSHDQRFDVTVEPAFGMAPVDYARNTCVATARDRGFDWLLMIDNDQAVPVSLLDIVAEAGPQIDVVALACGIGSKDGHSFMLNADFIRDKAIGNFMGISKAGSGVMLLRNSVWRTFPKGPWFVTEQNNDELRSLKQGEDIFFCGLCCAAGLQLWTHRMGCGHLKTADITQFAVPPRR